MENTVTSNHVNQDDYRLFTERMNEKVEIFLDGELIAETHDAIKLFEEGHHPVIYVPKNDLKNIDLIKFDDYHCPYKGDAELYDLIHKSGKISNAAWSYVDPYVEVEEIKGRVAFYPEKIDEIKISE